jgi:hypothetical protein
VNFTQQQAAAAAASSSNFFFIFFCFFKYAVVYSSNFCPVFTSSEMIWLRG